MILFTLSINYRGFALDFFPKGHRTNGDVIGASNEVHYRGSPRPMVPSNSLPLNNSFSRALEQSTPFVEPSQILPLIKGWLIVWSSWTKYTICGALKQPPLNWGSTPSLEFSNKVHHLFDTWVTFDYTFDIAKLRAWLWYHVRNHESPQWYDIIHFEYKLSWFCFGLPRRSCTNEDVFLTYKSMIIP